MLNPKITKYLKSSLVTFIIYVFLYIAVFVLLNDEKLNFFRFLFQGIILALIIPLFSKKFSPIPNNQIHKTSIVKKASLLIIPLFILIIILAVIFYLATKFI